MTTRHSSCSCGQLHLAIEGEPVRISMCHCLECQRRTGAVVSNQARYRREQIAFAGNATTWGRTDRKRQRVDLLLLSDMRLDGLLGERGFPRVRRCCDRKLCRRKFPRASYRGVGGIAPSLGSLCRPTHLPSAWRSKDDKTIRKTHRKFRGISSPRLRFALGQECRFSVTLFMPASARYRPLSDIAQGRRRARSGIPWTGAARGDTVRPRKFVLASAD